MPPADVGGWLEALPDVEADLRAPLASVLARDRDNSATRFLVAPSLSGPADTSAPSHEAGRIVGPYELLRVLGRGGMGEVWLARRVDGAYRRDVALKLPHAHLLAGSVAGRFGRERDILASLSHPNIARFYDAGLSSSGQPYLALEAVEGLPITQWANERRLGIRDRLRLFAKVNDAVAHAHSRLVAHRDLKPANVLVTAEGEARLLDFGIAKLLQDDDESTSPLTRADARLATPAYAAPEQLEGGAVTAATDVYSLATMLFELLTGNRPFATATYRQRPDGEGVAHGEPPPASGRVSAEHAARMGTTPEAARRGLQGDLDAILGMALQPLPEARYPSVAAFAADLERHLASQPIAARRKTLRDRASKFIHRHRWAVAATAAGLGALVVGSAAVAWQAREARIERDAARAEAERSEAVNQALMLMFREAGERGRVESVSARDLIDATAKRLVASLDPSEPSSAAVIGALSDLYVLTENVPGSKALLEAAFAKGIGGSDPVATARLKLKLAATLGATRQFVEARRLHEEADRIWQTDAERFRVERVETAGMEAYMRRLEGRRDEGIALLLQNMPDAERAYAGNSRDLATRYANLVTHLVEANRLEEAERLIARSEVSLASANQRQLPANLTLLQMRGRIALRRGDIATAEALFRQTAQTRRALYGRSYGLAVDLIQQGSALNLLGRPQVALEALAEAEPIAVGYFGANTQPVLLIGALRAESLALLGRLDEADRSLAAVAPGLANHGPDSLMNGLLHKAQALLALKRGDIPASRQALERAEAVFTRLGPSATPHSRALEAMRAEILATRP